jgi:hypothetical protein
MALFQSIQVNCCWPSSAQPLLVSDPYGTQDHSFVLSILLRVLKWGLLFDERRGLTTTGHSLSIGSDSAGCQSLTQFHSFSVKINSRAFFLLRIEYLISLGSHGRPRQTVILLLLVYSLS